MQDDVSEYMQVDPSMAYIENGRFRKKDEIEKRLPDTALSTVGLPATGSPLMLASPKGRSLITIDEEGTLYTYDADDDAVNWDSRETNVIPYTNETDFQSAPEAGMGICQAHERTNDAVSKYKIMAWEQKFHGLGASRECSIVVEVRKPNGDLWFREVIADARSPKIRVADNYEEPVLYFHNTDQDYIEYRVVSGGQLAGGVFTSNDITDMATEHPDIDGLQDNHASVSYRENDMRPGFSYDGQGHGYWDLDFGWPSDGTPGAGSIVWLDADQVRVRIASLYDYQGMGVDYVAKFGGTTRYTPLAVAYAPGYNHTAILYGEYDTVNSEGSIRIEIWDHDTNTVFSSSSRALDGLNYGEARCVSGDIVWDNSQASNEHFRFAVTVVGNEPWVMSSGRQSRTSGVIYGHYNTSLGITTDGNFPNHRLATELTFDKANVGGNARRLVFGVEQFNPNAVPNITGQGNNTQSWTDEFMSVPVLVRPHTTVVVSCAQSDPEGYQVIATLGAGQNKSMNASSAETDPHLNGAYLLKDSTEPRICVRNVLQPEDISWHNSSPAQAGKKTNVLFHGEAACRVAKLTPASTLKSRVYGEATYFSSAVPCLYDGVAFGEASVFDQPEITFINQITEQATNIYEGWAYEKLTTPGETDDWDRFQIVVGYADHLGMLHRSAPSTPVWISGMDAEDDDFYSAVIGFSCPLSTYRTQRDYFVEVYQAKGEGAMHLAAVARWNPSTDMQDAYVAFKMHHRVSNDWFDPIRWSEVLYTSDSVLPADPWPTYNDFVITSNRMFAVGSELPGTVYYSKLFEENIAPEFSAPLVLSLGRQRNLTAIGKIDDKVIVFTDDNEIFAIYDTGPDNTGANGDFVIDQLQTTIGCSDPESLVEIPEGLCFYSDRSREFHILSRDLQVHDIGKAIEDTAGSITDIKTALVVPDEHEIRWYVEHSTQQEFGETPATAVSGIPARPPRPRYQNVLPTNAVLVYNYHYKKWCVFSGQDGQHAVLYQNYPTYIESDWDVFKADPDAWGEEGHSLTIRTPWIRVNQLQSYGRIDDAVFLAKYLSDWKDNGYGFEAGDINVTVNYDYEENYDSYSPLGNPSDTYLFRANRGDLGGKGQTTADVFEGGPVPYEYRYGRCQFSVTPGRPKCQAIQFEISDQASYATEVNEPQDYVLGRGFAITACDLVYSPKQGMGDKTTPQRTSK
jgi:hypothetical protein